MKHDFTDEQIEAVMNEVGLSPYGAWTPDEAGIARLVLQTRAERDEWRRGYKDWLLAERDQLRARVRELEGIVTRYGQCAPRVVMNYAEQKGWDIPESIHDTPPNNAAQLLIKRIAALEAENVRLEREIEHWHREVTTGAQAQRIAENERLRVALNARLAASLPQVLDTEGKRTERAVLLALCAATGADDE